jgi:hypothetical protein
MKNWLVGGIIAVVALSSLGLYLTGTNPLTIVGLGQLGNGEICDSHDDCASQSCSLDYQEIEVWGPHDCHFSDFPACPDDGVTHCEYGDYHPNTGEWRVWRTMAPGEQPTGVVSGDYCYQHVFARVCVGSYCGDGITQSPQEDCDPGSPESMYSTCVLNGKPGFRTCSDGCTWGMCDVSSAECVPGEFRDCGKCGTEVCNDYGLWAGVCENQGVCQPGTSKTSYSDEGCPHTVTCSNQCTWPTVSDECSPDESTTSGCGGGQYKECGDNCQWESCQSIPGCSQGATETCGLCGTRTCNDRYCVSQSQWTRYCYTYGYRWGECLNQGVCDPGTTMTSYSDEGWPHEITCNSGCQWNPTPTDECSVGEKQGCTAYDGRLGNKYCENGDWSSCVPESECVPNSIESCGNCGTKVCSSLGTWGTCSGQGNCAPGQTRSVNSAQGCSHQIICKQDCSWPSTPVDQCMAGSTRLCNVDGVPGDEICNNVCMWGGCDISGECVPGDQKDCGECGIQDCNDQGVWGECYPDPNWQNICAENYVCARGNSYDCVLADAELMLTVDPDGYSVGQQFEIPVVVNIEGVDPSGFSVKGDIYRKDPIQGGSTGSAIKSYTGLTNSQGETELIYSISTKGDYVIEVVATKGSGMSQIRKEVMRDVYVITATHLDWEYEPVFYINNEVVFTIKAKDETESLLDVNLWVDAVDDYGSIYEAQIQKTSKGIYQVKFPAFPDETDLVVTAHFLGPNMNVAETEVKDFVVKTGVILIDHNIPSMTKVGKQITLELRPYTPDRDFVELNPNDEIKIWVEIEDGTSQNLQLSETGITTKKYSTSFTPSQVSGYYFKIKINKPGYEEVIYGEDPYPEIHMSATKGGDDEGFQILEYWYVGVAAVAVLLIALVWAKPGGVKGK